MQNKLPDIQQTEPKIKRRIREVGVQNVEVPFKLQKLFGGYNDMVARVSMRTNLNSRTKGVSMSRFILTLKEYLNKPLEHKLIKKILEDLRTNIGSKSSFMKFEFKMPITVQSIKSSHEFPIYYDCMFEGRLNKNNDFRFFQGVTVQYSSYCPCSAELSKSLRNSTGIMGFPHAQRSYATVIVETKEPDRVWLEEVISIIEESIPTLPYPIIKRVDEQEIARIASKNPLFVEDAIRAISKGLDNNNEIYDWIVKCTHEESIHTSEAIAINWKGVPGGLCETFFI